MPLYPKTSNNTFMQKNVKAFVQLCYWIKCELLVISIEKPKPDN